MTYPPQQPQAPYRPPQPQSTPPAVPYIESPRGPRFPPPGPAVPAPAPRPVPDPPSIWQRFGARVLDVVIVGGAVVVLTVLLLICAGITAQIQAAGAVWAILIAVLWLAGPAVYQILCIAKFGATLGKRIAGLRVVRIDNHGVPGFGKAALRWLIPIVGLFALAVGALVVYLSPLWDRTGHMRGWHDQVAGVVVIRTHAS